MKTIRQELDFHAAYGRGRIHKIKIKNKRFYYAKHKDSSGNYFYEPFIEVNDGFNTIPAFYPSGKKMEIDEMEEYLKKEDI